jgi:hypothetical protein
LPDPSSSLPGSHNGPDQPAGRTGRTCRRPSRCSLFDLAPGGVCLARLVTQPAGELLPHRFTLTSLASMKRPARRSAFCCTFPGLSAGGRYPPPCPAEPGLSSRRCRAGSMWRPLTARPATVRPAPNHQSTLYLIAWQGKSGVPQGRSVLTMLGWQLYCHPCELPVFSGGGSTTATPTDITLCRTDRPRRTPRP